NKGFEKITQYSFEEVKGENPRILKSGKTDPAIYEELWQTILSGRIWSGDLTNRRKDGSDYIENMTIVPLKNENDEPNGFIAIKKDVSEKLRMERELRQAQKLESIGQLAAGIAHEINTPIQYIGDNIRFLSSGFKELQEILNKYESMTEVIDDPERSKRLLKSVDTAKEEFDFPFLMDEIPDSIRQSLEGVENITRIVRAMKEFSHPGSREKTMTDINRCITTTITVAKNEWKYYADVVTDLDPGLPSTLCLPGELNQVLLNLITNAAQALAEMPRVKAGEKGKISIRTTKCADQITITVADDGPGIPEELQHRVFDPFFTTKEPGKGTGQGLTIAYTTVVEKLQGEIYFESTPAQGTTFVIKLPILQNNEVENENQSSVCR
ncbi:MAG: PAS domain-containing protein, partial [FCB group bacterium]|nr:PAS domain-containing protein [FCB group bacterium]